MASPPCSAAWCWCPRLAQHWSLRWMISSSSPGMATQRPRLPGSSKRCHSTTLLVWVTVAVELPGKGGWGDMKASLWALVAAAHHAMGLDFIPSHPDSFPRFTHSMRHGAASTRGRHSCSETACALETRRSTSQPQLKGLPSRGNLAAGLQQRGGAGGAGAGAAAAAAAAAAPLGSQNCGFSQQLARLRRVNDRVASALLSLDDFKNFHARAMLQVGTHACMAMRRRACKGCNVTLTQVCLPCALRSASDACAVAPPLLACFVLRSPALSPASPCTHLHRARRPWIRRDLPLQTRGS